MSTPHTAAAVTLSVIVCLCSSARGQLSHGDTERRLVLEALKTGILNSLGMDEPPFVRQKASNAELREMQRLYREKLGELGQNSSRVHGLSTLLLPHTVQKLRPGLRADMRKRPHHWHRAEFTERPSIHVELSLVRAQLYMSRQVLGRAAARVKVHIRGAKSTTKQAVWADITANGNMTESLVLDVSAEVQKWIQDDEGPLVVHIQHKGADYNFNISLKLTYGHKTIRTTRSVKEEECDEQDLCCRQSMTVSFKDIGWTDWVVAPLEYTMHFCRGSCPHNYRPASMHTQVKSRLAQISKGGIPRPCCVPAAYQPMVLMHYDSRGKLKLTPFEDLIVTKCHCA